MLELEAEIVGVRSPLQRRQCVKNGFSIVQHLCHTRKQDNTSDARSKKDDELIYCIHVQYNPEGSVLVIEGALRVFPEKLG